jgi:exodeoxyribonuclease V gamma subunit
MSGLKIYTSNRLEILADQLAQILRTPLRSPLQKEIILVQSRGMERWVSLELASRLGICANCAFPFPNHFVQQVFREVLPQLPEENPFDPSVLTWEIMAKIPHCIERPGFEPLRRYLGKNGSLLKRYQLSCRIADLFDQYLLFRPQMILDWEKGKESDWQAVLWRELMKGKTPMHRARTMEVFLQEVLHFDGRWKTLPERMGVFGISSLPPFHLRVLKEISRFVEVHLFLLNPCEEFWADIVSQREARRLKRRRTSREIPTEELHLERGNQLLASMGMLGRDFFAMVGDLDGEEEERFEDPGTQSLLTRIQSDILHLRDRGGRGVEKDPIDPDDRSIQVHSCHSPLREVEVLQDYLLGLFSESPDLRPKDILVMAPDIRAYAPFIQGVFSLPPEDPRYIPFTIADRGLQDESLLWDAFLALLELEGSRFGVSQVLSLLECPWVQRKFALSASDLETIREWVRATNIRWGIDEESRAELGLPALSENTWRAGLDRLILGYALPEEEDRVFQGILPYGKIEGGEAETLGKFLSFMEGLFRFARDLRKRRTLVEWSGYLLTVLETFFQSDEGAEREILFIRRAIQDLAHKGRCSGFSEKVGMDVVAAALRASLDREGGGSGFLGGGITFCSLLPMRSIPSPVIALMGMNDDAYPRQAATLSFDRMALHPQPGDRSRRNDDRYLFLETLLSARRRLFISYVGQSAQDNSLRPPSVLVSELLDYIDQGFSIEGKSIRDHVVVCHRLQAFHPDYFRNGESGGSYAPENFEGAKVLREGRKSLSPFISGKISPPSPEWRRVEMNQLGRFFSHPARFLLNQRLQLFLPDESAPWDDREPMDLVELAEYGVGQDLVERALKRKDLYGSLPLFRASGQLPHGRPGDWHFYRICQEVQDFLEELAPWIEAERQTPIQVDLPIADFQVVGEIRSLYAGRLVHFRFAKVKPKDRLNLWIEHLILSVLPNSNPLEPSRLICRDRRCEYPIVEDSRTYLAKLLAIYWEGLQRPIPFFPRTSWAYAEKMLKSQDHGWALSEARKTWQPEYKDARGEKEDPYFSLCFREPDPLNEEFASLAMEVFGPILQWEKKV